MGQGSSRVRARRKITLLTEDRYGVEFLKRLIHSKLAGLIDVRSVSLNIQRIAGLCSLKFTRQLTLLASMSDKTIIIVDGNGQPNKVYESIYEKHVKQVEKRLRNVRIAMVVLDKEIEEWVCLSLNIKYGHKPSEALNEYLRRKHGARLRYEKYMLPDFTDKLDIQKLIKLSRSFRKFIHELKN